MMQFYQLRADGKINTMVLMKELLLSCLLAAVVSFPLCAKEASDKEIVDDIDYVSGFEDLPLMDGVIERTDLNFSFDSLEGRIVQSYIETDKPFSAVKEYYDSTLKDLGWKKLKDGSYKRDDGVLTIEEVQQNPLLVKFEFK